MELTARVKTTFVRGNKVFDGGNIVGKASGKYLHRPY
jgi:allantoinase